MPKRFERFSDLVVMSYIQKQGLDLLNEEELDDFISWFHQQYDSLPTDLQSTAQQLSHQAYKKRISQFKDQIKSLPPLFSNLKSEKQVPTIKKITELEQIINWIKKQLEYSLPSNLQSELHRLERTTYIRLINYRQYHQLAFPPEEILAWLNNNPSIEKEHLSAIALRSEAFYRKLDSFNDPAAALKWFEEKFDLLKIDELNEFLNWYQKHKPFPEKVTDNIQKMLHQSKDKIFQSIQQDIKQQKNRLLENYPFLEELSLGEITLLGQGNFATIIEGYNQKNIVIKIPNDPSEYISPEGYLEFVQEAKNHQEFQLAIAKLKRSELLPDWLVVPKVSNAPDELPSSPFDMLYTMEKVHGFSLKRLAFLRLPRLRDQLCPFSESEIRHLSEMAFDMLLQKRKITLDEFKMNSGLVPSLFFEVFTPDTELGKKFQKIEGMLIYMKEHEKVVHTDLHSDNILIDEETETLYLIDFGIVITSSSQ